jgi:hypothetical protein
MTTPSMTYKKLLCSHGKQDRDRILHTLSNWFMQQNDGKARAISTILQQLCDRNGWQSDQAFINDPLWFELYSYDTCESFIQIVSSKLVIPVQREPKVEKPKVEKPKVEKPKEHRKAIPKKIRGEAWSNAFGDSMKGQCHCCKKELHAFDIWHAGHSVSYANGGKDTVSNLRPICTSCNLSMGTQDMNVFIQTYYNPNP